eukprot:6009004-Pleurochrysis_carterae.AAC.1
MANGFLAFVYTRSYINGAKLSAHLSCNYRTHECRICDGGARFVNTCVICSTYCFIDSRKSGSWNRVNAKQRAAAGEGQPSWYNS